MVELTQALQGLSRAEAQFNQAAAQIARAPGQPGDQIDLSTEAVALLQSRNSFEANTKVIKIADEMQQTLLHMVA